MRRTNVEQEGGLGFTAVIKGFLFAVVITILCAGLYSFITSQYPFVERSLPLVARSVAMCCAFAGGIVAGRSSEKAGWVHGAIVGLLYSLVIVLTGAFIAPGSAPLVILVQRFAITMIVSAIGGIAGVNL